mmetsp:Transcript_10061/g.29650  ORF Transcript_10061/g.29650 Transcript_10061/m.29650 type:complete len:469 (+) Transcript_10061:123-1529(+)
MWPGCGQEDEPGWPVTGTLEGESRRPAILAGTDGAAPAAEASYPRTRPASEVNGLVVGVHGRLLEGLAHGWVRVACPRHVLRARAVLHCEDAFRDHLPRVAGDDVHAEDLARARLSKELDEPVRVHVGARARVGHEGELAHGILHPGLLQFLLRLTHSGYLGMRVDDARNAVVVNVPVQPRDVLHNGDALLLRLVSEHGPTDAVADSPDAGHVGLELVVHLDGAAGPHLDAHVLEPEALRVGHAADGDEHDVHVQRLLLARLVRLDGERDAVAGALALDHLGVELELHALLGEGPLEGLCDLVVHAGADAVQELYDRHLRAEAAPHGAHLQANDAGADDNHLLGDGGELESARGGDNLLLVDGHWRQRRRLGARGDDNVLARDGACVLALEIGHSHRARRGQLPLALDVIHLVLFEQALNARGKSCDGLGLVLHELVQLDAHVVRLDAVRTPAVRCLFVQMGGVEKRL